MKEELKVALIQSNLIWENPTLNRANFSKKIESISESTDLIILPEMFTTGFTMNTQEVSETMEGETVKWMQDMAKKTP